KNSRESDTAKPISTPFKSITSTRFCTDPLPMIGRILRLSPSSTRAMSDPIGAHAPPTGAVMTVTVPALSLSRLGSLPSGESGGVATLSILNVGKVGAICCARIGLATRDIVPTAIAPQRVNLEASINHFLHVSLDRSFARAHPLPRHRAPVPVR